MNQINIYLNINNNDNKITNETSRCIIVMIFFFKYKLNKYIFNLNKYNNNNNSH